MTAPPHKDLPNNQNSELRKLAEYEQLCGGAIIQKSSFFVPTPTSPTEAVALANDLVNELRAFSRAGVKPLVIMEPTTTNGAILNLASYRQGAYDLALDTYFKTIRSEGVTDSQMGMWTFLPEGNSPVWNDTNPDDFRADVTKTAQYLKTYFPGSQATILLNSKTYPDGTSWDNGSYSSLVPYVSGIPVGLIDSFGLQGFPWAVPANQAGDSSYDPSVYLPANLAASAAQTLGVKQIWLNTGTFGRAYANSPTQLVTMAADKRSVLLSGVLNQAVQLRQQGYTVAIHLFSQNKAQTAEAIDWSYWPINSPVGPGAETFKSFVHDSQNQSVGIWIFDTY